MTVFYALLILGGNNPAVLPTLFKTQQECQLVGNRIVSIVAETIKQKRIYVCTSVQESSHD